MKTRILLILFAVLLNYSSYSQKDTIHMKGQNCIGLSFDVYGKIETGGTIEDPNDTRLGYHIRLRGHHFIFNKVAFGTGVHYFDYYFSLKEKDFGFNKVWNFDIYSRYYPLKWLYIEPNLLYGGICRSPISEYQNKNNWIGGFSIGLEIKLKNKFSIDFDAKTLFDLRKSNCFGSFGQTGFFFGGVTYFF